jgi:predicted Zn-dependent peptidase
MDEGLTLMEMLLSEAKADEAALRNVVSDILVKREHAKRNRDYILRQALANYGKYGPDSPFRHRLSAQELRAAEAATLVDLIKGLSAYPHDIHYYGPKPVEAAAERLRRARRAPNAFSPLPAPEKHFEQLPTTSPQVLFVDFPIVQTDILMLSKGRPRFDLDEHIMAKWYNDYFGGGLSSIVFQEIRESKALAYSTYAHYSSPARHDEAHYLQAYVGTQPDKVPDAVSALVDIIEHMPAAPDQIETSRISILRQIESERIPPRKLYWAARSVWDLGLNHDLRQDIHRRLQAERHQALLDFHHRAVRGRAFTFLVLGAKNSLEWSFLQSIGQIRELSMDDIFGP